MAINIKFDLLNNPEPPTLILANRNGNKLGQLDVNPESVELIDKFNEASEISFTVNKYVDGKITNLWDKLVDFKLIYCKEWDVWFECTVELDEATESVKTVFCTQLGQAELSQIMLYDIEINTEADIERPDYKIGILYDPLDSQCILSRLLEKAPHYSIIHVDETLWNIQRSFSFDSTSIYDALQEIAEEIGCLFVFNSDSDANGMPQRTISVYDLQQNCNDCDYRGEFTDKCPKCESTNIKYGYGDDTLIFVTSDELASEGIQLVTDTDSVKNCFKLEAGDDLMTATVRNRNPNGTDYIWYFSEATKSDMPDELVQKIEEYDKSYQYFYKEFPSFLDDNLLARYNGLVDKYSGYYNDEDKTLEKISSPIIGFASLMQAYYNTIDLGWYLKSGMMPTVKISKTDAQEQGDILSIQLPSLIAVTDLKIVSKATADSTVLMMAKAIVSSAYKVVINSSQLTGNNWSGSFVITNYSDEEDTCTTGVISRTLVDWDETQIRQKIEKILSKENTDDYSITGLFEKDYDEFCAELKKYALTPLTSFHDACQTCIDILIEQGVGNTGSWGTIESGDKGNLYEKLYVPYYNKLMAIESEMVIRESEVNLILGVYDINGNLVANGLQTNIERLKAVIQDNLNFQNYLGEDLWLQFCAYRREDKYSNSNYISDGLNNAELFERALQFYEVAENEIFKSAELQHSISATLNNLLAIPKFKPLVKSFEVGNWIRVQIDDHVYKLRLVEYVISYGSFDNISVEFSDVAKTKNGYSDLEDILSDASSMASSYDGIQRQANLGNEARDMIRQWLNEGLDASLIQIQNNVNEDILIDNNGLIGRSKSDITGEYSPEQIRLTHNIIAFTEDNWKSVTQAIGKHKYKYYDEGKKDFVDALGYGLSANFVTAGVISGSQIIGGDVYSDNYSEANSTGSYINLRDGTFNFGGGRITFNGEELNISSPDLMTVDQVTTITNNTLKTTNVIAKNLQVKAANVSGELSAATISANSLTSGTIDAKKITIENLTFSNIDGSITWNDLDSDAQKKVNDAQTTANNAVSTANAASLAASSAQSTVSGWTYSGSTYIDGSKIMTGTVKASKLQGGTINLLDFNGNTCGSMLLNPATTGAYAVGLISNAAMQVMANAGNLYLSSANTFIQCHNDTNYVTVGVVNFNTWGTLPIIFAPSADGYGTLGAPMQRWQDVYSMNPAINTSDKREKNNIEYNLDKYESFFHSLKPTQYKFIDNTSNRYHIGFISQDIEDSLINNGLTSLDFAGFIKSPKYSDDKETIEDYSYGLRYGEFIALNTHMIQKLYKRIEELESKVMS